MKKLLSILLLILLTFCGCSKNAQSKNIETLKGWLFQHNKETNDYSVFFGLYNENDEYISADVDVDIRIEDKSGNELYNATHSVSEDDFDYYSSKVAGERYLAEIRIKESEIKEGTSTSGTVYLTVYKEDDFSFDEVNCEAHYCLPVKEVLLEADYLPVEVNIKNYSGKTKSTIRIEDVSYKVDDDMLDIIVSGVKTYGNESSTYDTIKYKLYDSEGYIVDSGDILLDNLAAGDKFKDDSITFYDAVPGETYKIKFSEEN